MRNLLQQLLWFLVVILLAPLIWACSVEAFSFVFSNLDFGSLDWFLLGITGCVCVYGAVRFTQGKLYSHFQFIRNLRHELTHSVATITTGGNVHEMLVVNPVYNSGAEKPHVSSSGLGCLSCLTALAPYYLPLFTIPPLIMRIFLPSTLPKAVEFLIGFTLAFHFISFLEEFVGQKFGLGQSDITNTGVLVSYILIAFFNLVSWVVIKAALHDEWPTLDRLWNALEKGRESYGVLFETLKSYIRLFAG